MLNLNKKMTFTLPKLNFSYDALEPHIDSRTMEIHHSKHHQGYTNKLNAALENIDLSFDSIEDLLAKIDMKNMALRNNAGGFYNHKLFWEIMTPSSSNEMSLELKDTIEKSFGTFNEFKSQFSSAAASRFGSGWAWLCVKDGALEVCSSANQDNPLMPMIGCGGTPILGIDVWEHAYYLNYQNRRPDYIEAFFSVLNWEEVQSRFDSNK